MAEKFPRHRGGWPEGTFLGSLTPPALDDLLVLATRRRYEGGRTILREGDTGSHVVILESGFVKVTTTVDGHSTLLGIRLPGELIGEIGPLTDSPRNATVTACGTIHVGIVGRAAFEDFLRRRSEVAKLVLATIARQLTWANRRRSDFAAFPAQVRLARLLVEIAEVCGHTLPNGHVEIVVPLSHPELAAMIAIARATVQKAVQDLRSRALISTSYRRIVILNLPALTTLAEPPT